MTLAVSLAIHFFWPPEVNRARNTCFFFGSDKSTAPPLGSPPLSQVPFRSPVRSFSQLPSIFPPTEYFSLVEVANLPGWLPCLFGFFLSFPPCKTSPVPLSHLLPPNVFFLESVRGCSFSEASPPQPFKPEKFNLIEPPLSPDPLFIYYSFICTSALSSRHFFLIFVPRQGCFSPPINPTPHPFPS